MKKQYSGVLAAVLSFPFMAAALAQPAPSQAGARVAAASSAGHADVFPTRNLQVGRDAYPDSGLLSGRDAKPAAAIAPVRPVMSPSDLNWMAGGGG